MTQALREKIANAIDADFYAIYRGDKSFNDTADAIIDVISDSVEPLKWYMWGNEWDANNPFGGSFTVKVDGDSGFYLYTSEEIKATDFWEMVQDRSTPDDCMKQAFMIVRYHILSPLGLVDHTVTPS